MNYETAADSFIRPLIGLPAQPAHGPAPGSAEPRAVQTATAGANAASEPGAKADHETAAAEFNFYDLLDLINPLQHIPVVSSAYRELTGDEIKAPTRILGGFLLGGPVGLVTALANAMVEESSGRDIAETALAMVFGEDTPADDNLAEAAKLDPQSRGQAVTGNAGTDDLGVMASEDKPAAAQLPTASPAAAETIQQSDGLLTGQAALSALYNDMMRKRQAEPAAPAAEQAVDETDGVRPENQVPANLAGLGIRDKRSSAQSAPVVSIPAAHLVPRTAHDPQAPATAAVMTRHGRPSEGPAAAIPSSTYVPGPRVPGSRGIDPTLFIPAKQAEPTPASTGDAAAPEDISAQMMQALGKYEHMLQERQRQALP